MEFIVKTITTVYTIFTMKKVVIVHTVLLKKKNRYTGY